MRSYNLDPTAARAAEAGRIETTGPYLGVITRAEAVVSDQKGTEGIELSFKADNGMTADYLSLWTYTGDGKPLRGQKVLMALMTVAKVKSLTATVMNVERMRDGKKVVEAANCYPELQGKRVGLILQKEDYRKNDGTIGSRMSIFLPYCAESSRTASEILVPQGQPPKPAEALARILPTVKDRPLQVKSGAAAPSGSASAGGPAPTGGLPSGFEDDDIPF